MGTLSNTAYRRWMESEEVPIIEGYGIQDVLALDVAPWPRLGGKGAFVELNGMEGVTGLYVAEIPPGKALLPERHLYEEVVCILQGRGWAEVWRDPDSKQRFEWGPWSVFAVPVNCWHRLVNAGTTPARFMAATNAPLILDVFHNPEFVFGCDCPLPDRYDGREAFFVESEQRHRVGLQAIWETNFIYDVRQSTVDSREAKGAGVKITQFEMSENTLVGHLSEWPVGRYHKAHYHGPGAVLLILRSEGYVQMWPKEAGVRPYENGHGGDVVELHWKPGSIYCPPSGWFHQHFNTGSEPARQLALRYGSCRHPLGFMLALRHDAKEVNRSIREGGTLIEYEDEDPEIRRKYELALRAKGIACQMPPVVHRTDPFPKTA